MFGMLIHEHIILINVFIYFIVTNKNIIFKYIFLSVPYLFLMVRFNFEFKNII